MRRAPHQQHVANERLLPVMNRTHGPAAPCAMEVDSPAQPTDCLLSVVKYLLLGAQTQGEKTPPPPPRLPSTRLASHHQPTT